MKTEQAWTEYCKSLAPTIATACVATPAAAGPIGLAKALDAALPEWKFRHAFVRGGWYRLGGIVDAAGQRISDNLEQWVETALDERDGDLGQLGDDFADAGYFATRLIGQTHYLTAAAGDDVDDYLQLEIEELQEIRGHRLFANEPSTLEELVDPRDGGQGSEPIGLPHYVFRRLLHVGAFLRRMQAQQAEPAPIHRMIADWASSSAGATSAWYNHWVIATREHLDRYHQPVFRAQPIATLEGAAPEFGAAAGTTGLGLHAALSRFDRQAGYPMAWYFHMLSTKAVPHWVAQAAVEDALAGFAYLPQKDVDIVRNWLHRPYAA